MEDDPARTVLAFTRLIESQISVACWFEAIVALDEPATPVVMVTVYDPLDEVAF
jgi:hypothetical protein